MSWTQEGKGAEFPSRWYALPQYQRLFRHVRSLFLRDSSVRAEVSDMHVLMRSWKQDPRIGSDVDRSGETSMEERIGEVVHGMAPESKTPGMYATKSLIFWVWQSGLVSSNDCPELAFRSMLFRRPSAGDLCFLRI